MAVFPKHLGRRREWRREGSFSIYTYEGTEAEIDALLASHTIGELDCIGSPDSDAAPAGADDGFSGASTDNGTLVSMTKSQTGGNLWSAELCYEVTGSGGGSATPPSNAWGRKSASLRGSTLTCPLSEHRNYLAIWDHYLAASPTAPAALPAWWATAKTIELPASLSFSYRWLSSPAELPMGWRILRSPTKPFYSTYTVATYSITETAKYRSSSAAGRSVAGKLNHVGSPFETFGLTGGNWKCDDASVQWDGKRWLATTTWTKSPSAAGWDKELYPD